MNCPEDFRPLSRVIDVVFRTEMALYKQNGWYYVLLAGAYKGVGAKNDTAMFVTSVMYVTIIE